MKKAETLLKKFNNLKTLPVVAIRLSKLILDDKSTMKDFEEVIKLDPTLVFRLLGLVNSPYYGLHQKVEDISRAVIFIGLKNLRNLVVTEALKDIFKNSSDNGNFSRTRLWLHCAAASIFARMVAERIFEQKGEDAFLCGILHDIGMIVEDQVANDSFSRTCEAFATGTTPITRHEKEILGTDHCSVGFLLAREWNFPIDVQEGIKLHHRFLKSVSPSSIVGINQMAEYFVSRMNYPALPGMSDGLSPPLADHVRNNLDEYDALIEDFPEEMAKAKDLYESQGA
jgi:HD-like signal output (HDOD) protein